MTRIRRTDIHRPSAQPLTAAPRADAVRPGVILLAGGALALAAACSSGSPASPAAPASPAGTPAVTSQTAPASAAGSASAASSPGQAPGTTTSPGDPATAEVLAAYRGYWAARVKALAAPDQPPPAELETYAIDRARTDVNASLLLYRQQGIAFRGEPALSPSARVTASGTNASASISDCEDTAHWTPVFVATGKSALAPGQPARVSVEATARIYSGRWVIDSFAGHRDRSC